MPCTREEIGGRIRALRQQHSLSQEELAHRINRQQKDISNYEKGTASIPAEVLFALADVLETPVIYFAGQANDQYADIDWDFQELAVQLSPPFRIVQLTVLRSTISMQNTLFNLLSIDPDRDAETLAKAANVVDMGKEYMADRIERGFWRIVYQAAYLTQHFGRK